MLPESVIEDLRDISVDDIVFVDNEDLTVELKKTYPTLNIFYRTVAGMCRAALDATVLKSSCVVINKDSICPEIKRKYPKVFTY